MKKNFFLTALLTGIVLISIPSSAQLRGSGFLLAASYSIPSESSINNGFGSTIGFLLPVSHRLSISLEWKYGHYSVDKNEEGFLNGDLYVTPLLLCLRYDFVDEAPVVPYLFGGGGWFFATFNAQEQQSIDESAVIKQEPKGGLGLFGGLGVYFRISNNLALYGEGMYLLRNTDMETVFISSPAEAFSVNLSALNLQVGNRYFY